MAINKFRHLSSTPLDLSGRINSESSSARPQSPVVFTESIQISLNNSTGGGIIFADDGDIVDLNDFYCSFRFVSGVRIYSANKGGSPVITLESGGNIVLANSGTTTRGLLGTSGDNDLWFFGGGATGSNAGFAQISTGDDGNEPIYVRQYIGDPRSGTLQRTTTLLDGSGNTLINNTTATGTASQPLQVTGGAYVSGNLGIGTTNPSDKLHLLGNNIRVDSLTGSLNFWNGSGWYGGIGVAGGLGGSGTDIAIRAEPSRGIIFFTGGANDRGRIDADGTFLVGAATSTGTASQRLQVTGGAYVSGNLGVGATNPATALEIYTADPILTIRDTSTSITNANATLRLAESNASNGLDNYWDIVADTTAGNWGFTVKEGTTTRLAIQPATGNVGIGTDIPNRLLTLKSTTPIIGLTDYDSGGEFYIQNSSGSAVLSADFYRILTNTNSDVVRITSTGNVGINSTTPTQKFDVNGNIGISNISVTGATTATLSTLTETAIHTGLLASTYRSVEYTIQATQGTNFHSTKVLVVHDGSTAYHNEYGTVYNNSSVATFNADISGGNLRLLASGASASSTVYKIYFVATKV